MRRLLAPSFNEQSLRSQAHVLDEYAAKFIQRINALYEEHAKRGEPAVADFLDWSNFYAIDVIGDLAIGESFHCLDGSSYHPWVKTLSNFFKGMIIVSAARSFPVTEYLLQRMIPKHILEKQRQHTEFTNTKIRQRLEMKTERPDLITPFLQDMKTSPDKMSLGEIQSTFAVILVAGSEATATTLVGVFYQLASHSEVQERLWGDLKDRYSSESDIKVKTTKDIDYLDAVINETFRLCYAIPGGLPRIVPEGGDIYGGYFVPGGVRTDL